MQYTIAKYTRTGKFLGVVSISGEYMKLALKDAQTMCSRMNNTALTLDYVYSPVALDKHGEHTATI